MSDKQKNFISAVVYVYNAANNIDFFLKTLINVLDSNFDKFEIICVNDASSDGSKEIIKKFGRTSDNCMLSILNMSYHQGLEMAMHAGADLAIGDFVFEFDRLAQDYDPSLIMQVYCRSLEGYDIVSCGKGHARASSGLFYSVFNRHSGMQYMLKSETFQIGRAHV